MPQDEITIEILADGSMKIETGKVSGPNHVNATGLIRAMTEQAGGAVTRTTKAGSHHHGHGHTHGQGEGQHQH